jgi:hypothetical protein
MERFNLLFLLLFPWHVVAAQETAATGMPTIEVDFFTRLEKQLMEAVVKQDRSALEPLLTSDFELRTSRTGGELTFRDEWLQEAISTYKVRSFRISGLTVRPVATVRSLTFSMSNKPPFRPRRCRSSLRYGEQYADQFQQPRPNRKHGMANLAGKHFGCVGCVSHVLPLLCFPLLQQSGQTGFVGNVCQLA